MDLMCSTLDPVLRMEEKGINPQGLALVVAALAYLTARPGMSSANHPPPSFPLPSAPGGACRVARAYIACKHMLSLRTRVISCARALFSTKLYVALPSMEVKLKLKTLQVQKLMPQCIFNNNAHCQLYPVLPTIMQ